MGIRINIGIRTYPSVGRVDKINPDELKQAASLNTSETEGL